MMPYLALIKQQSQWMHQICTPATEGTISFRFSASKQKIKLRALHLLQLQGHTEACPALRPAGSSGSCPSFRQAELGVEPGLHKLSPMLPILQF